MNDLTPDQVKDALRGLGASEKSIARQVAFTARHVEPPSVRWQPLKRIERDVRLPPMTLGDRPDSVERWGNEIYVVSVRRYRQGFFVGNSAYVVLGISAHDGTARHDWREFQWIKNDVVGPTWEAVELYPAESRLVDPSNAYYLFCAPPGCFQFGMEQRRVGGPNPVAPQRPFAPPCPPDPPKEGTP